MYQYKGLEDTIAAIATPAGQGGIGIVRISGKAAIAVADALLCLEGQKKLAHAKSHTVHHGWAIDPQSGETLDEVLVTFMKGPKSYTAEDVVEINAHGGMTVLKTILEAVLKAGSRLAAPGEFTKRAFLHGRIDLAQAEAVLDIIQAKTQISLRQSQHQLKGELSDVLYAIREELLKLYTMVEALINFPEDDIESQGRQDILDRLGLQLEAVHKLIESSQTGRILKEGVRIVLCGQPNVGKSSLLNALLKTERAIVTDIAGTTRDVLEESAQIKGLPVSLVDTAGLFKPRDIIEQEAVKRSRLYIKSADLILLVLDASRALQEGDMRLLEELKTAPVLVVVNKIDLDGKMDESIPAGIFGHQRLVKTSVFQIPSIQALETKIIDLVGQDKNLDTHGLLVSNVRHLQALQQAQTHLQSARRLMGENTSLEFISEEIKSAVNRLDAITGRNIDEDLLDRIFSAFCIGK